MGSSASEAVHHVDHVDPAVLMPSDHAWRVNSSRPIDAFGHLPHFDPFVTGSTQTYDRTPSDTRQTYDNTQWRHQPRQQRQLAHQRRTAEPMPGSLFHNGEAGQQLLQHAKESAFQTYPLGKTTGAIPLASCLFYSRWTTVIEILAKRAMTPAHDKYYIHDKYSIYDIHVR